MLGELADGDLPATNRGGRLPPGPCGSAATPTLPCTLVPLRMAGESMYGQLRAKAAFPAVKASAVSPSW